MNKRDHQRFEALLHEHRGIVFKVAGAYARDMEDRRDLAQEICTQLWRAFPSFDEARGRFSTWMYRIALNVAISQHRRVSGEPAFVESLGAEHLEQIGVEAVVEPDERLTALYRFIGELDPLHRALILLYLEDRSYADIADVLGISVTNVATKIGRVKQRLRAQASQAALVEGGD
ncbi:RNA polymerase sigma factor [Dyella sp. ASV21]|uniref:RNA polymerase sigma factor n=1 Tax=Dyella sp. ASV21 TaxID=2795114 RepID=UPI0018ED5AC2|nr:RNA polymerase sigma factor [Dyella sp. ASV21]